MAQAAPAAGDFTFPRWYQLPASFTVQPVPETRAKQWELWCQMLNDYCGHKQQWHLGPGDEVFVNKSISRRLSDEGVQGVLQSMVAQGTAFWIDEANHSRGVWVFRRPIREWAAVLTAWADEQGWRGPGAGPETVAKILLPEETGPKKPWDGMSREMIRIIAEKGLAGKAHYQVDREGGEFGDWIKFD
eukprot:TRINITY_DN60868_c0_g1_i1.p2 TRINITY_DN60868_c0_g1~~TRINITY_DN60868_c0_g1_i1.p2  ORF type:complete len:188 (+),score=57.50 TRINITY_DN60868_c0_g1_i1:81-644(+)